jgi:hypothetical protein
MMHKNRVIFNVVGIIGAIFVLVFNYWARKNLNHYIDFTDYIQIFCLSVSLLILPDLIGSCHKNAKSWWRNEEMYSILLLLLFSVSGLFIKSITYISLFLLIALAILSFLYLFSQISSHTPSLPILGGLFFMMLIVLSYYCSSNHSPVFPEKIIQGNAHIDTLFHGSISNIISNFKISSTGLDSLVYFNYHWGSHAIFAGLKTWSGNNTLMFYSIGYPAIFIPLFFKTYLGFCSEYMNFKGIKSIDSLFLIAFFTTIYSVAPFGFKRAAPLSGESYTVALVLLFLYLSILLKYHTSIKKYKGYFLAFSFFLFLIISFSKISTAFVVIAGLMYISYRYFNKKTDRIILISGGLLLAGLVYVYIFPKARTTIDQSILVKYYSLWIYSDSFLTYLFSLIFALLIILKEQSIIRFSDFKNLIKKNQYPEFEFLLIVLVTGALAAIITSSNASDVYYFNTNQFYFGLIVFVFYLHKKLSLFKSAKKYIQLFMLMIIVLGIVSKPELIKKKGGALQFITVKEKHADLTPRQQLLHSLISDLFLMEKSEFSESSCIYIPRNELWYYKSQKKYPLSAPMIVPCISGMPLIYGIPESLLNSNYNYYSYFYYRKHKKPYPEDLSDVLKRAKKEGYKNLILYSAKDQKLDKKIYNLTKKASNQYAISTN